MTTKVGMKTSWKNHILEQHTDPDKDNKFPCDECKSRFETKDKLKTHYRKEHKGKTDENTVSEEDPAKLREQLRQLKNNFERLESLFQDSLEEVNQVRSEYEAKLMEANDKFRSVKAENEELKEKVDVLFKLGRSYINRKENNEPTANQEKPDEMITANTETITIEEENVDDLQTWTKNKLRGFKRVSPSAPAANKPKPSESVAKKPSPSSVPTRRTPSVSSPTNSSVAPPSGAPASNQGGQPRFPAESGRTLYCHFFSNFGKCTHEERTGHPCRFEHKAAPVCQSGMACKRIKCMYNHPNPGGMRNSSSFLDQTNFFPQNTNPWQMMNPWWNQNQNQIPFSNPWNIPSHRN